LILFLSPRKNDSSLAIQSAAESALWRVHRLDNWRVPSEFFGVTDDVTAYGEPLFVAAIADSLNLTLIEPQFSWLSKLPFIYTKRKTQLTTLDLARHHADQIFAKPADDKCFAAGVYDCGAAIVASQLLPDDTPVILSEVVDWTVECRYFILERSVMCWSAYSLNGDLVDDSFVESDSDTTERTEFVQSLLNDVDVGLPPAVVIDVGKIRGRGWAVIEANPVFGSGIYKCDPIKVLPVLARSIVRTDKLSPSDKSWVIQRDDGSSA